ncbi:MAG: M23 family metallopeptidase [Nitrosomonadales bacterium]|nr:M23 family metallopeptidase [Nitrosomonadales bacterium]
MAIAEKITIRPPVDGEWKFLRPPGHHPYAFDFVQTDVQRRSTHRAARWRYFADRILSNEFHCWNQPVYAPIDGEVIGVGDGWPDHEYTNIWETVRIWYNATYKFRPKEKNGRLDIRPNAGNHVMIQAKQGHIVFLAHLRNQSVSVKEGQHVRQGEVIGRVGNSGNSTAPHLHINLFDQMANPFAAKVLPFVFDGYELLSAEGQWLRQILSAPKAGSFVRFND